MVAGEVGKAWAGAGLARCGRGAGVLGGAGGACGAGATIARKAAGAAAADGGDRRDESDEEVGGERTLTYCPGGVGAGGGGEGGGGLGRARGDEVSPWGGGTGGLRDKLPAPAPIAAPSAPSLPPPPPLPAAPPPPAPQRPTAVRPPTTAARSGSGSTATTAAAGADDTAACLVFLPPHHPDRRLQPPSATGGYIRSYAMPPKYAEWGRRLLEEAEEEERPWLGRGGLRGQWDWQSRLPGSRVCVQDVLEVGLGRVWSCAAGEDSRVPLERVSCG